MQLNPARQQQALIGSPLVAGGFSLLAWGLVPMFRKMFAGELPAFTERFLAVYPYWALIALVTVALSVWAAQLGPESPLRARLLLFDALLGIASLFMIVWGLIALALPVVMAPSYYG